ncbi:PAS domain S-box protein [candidate division TA06 bacterium]|nr:PAS domain S-box protein [candidate division TA06 bacterium]
MTKRQIMEKIPFKLLAVFLLLAAGISAGGYFYYKQQRVKAVQHIYEDLNTIASLKSEEITAWRRERYGDAFVITRSQQFAFSVRRWYQNPGDKNLKEYIYKRLDAFRIYDTYKDVILVDPAGKARMFIDQGGSENLSQATLSFVREAERQNRIIFSDFYYCEKCREVHLDVITPLHDGETNAGAIILRINPDKFLYPLIQRWPSVSKSGETVLVRKEGNEVVYLNELRHQKGTALRLRLPITDTLLPAAMAVMSKEGLVEGTDYRDVPVVAAIVHISDSPWFMVVKMDKKEIYAPLNRQARNIMFVTALTVIALAALLSFFWQADRRSFYKKQYQMELEKQALIKHYDYLTRYANDIIFLLDDDHKVREINERALEVYGYTREEFIGMNADQIRADDQRALFKAQMNQLAVQKGLLYETMHKRKDGSTFPVEISARTIEIEGKNYLQGIVRDITEHKQYEMDIQERNEELVASNQELTAAEEELRLQMDELQKSKEEITNEKIWSDTLIQSAPNIVIGLGERSKILLFNSYAEKLTGYKADEVLGKNWIDIFIPEEQRQQIYGVWDDILKNKYIEHQYENPVITKNKETRLISWSNSFLTEKGRFKMVLSLGQDITERKQAEAKIAESEQKFRQLAENIDMVFWLTDWREKKLLYVNPAYEKIFGLTVESAYSDRMGWKKAVHPDDLERVSGELQRHAEKEEFTELEYRIICQGEIKWIHEQAFPLKDEAGKVIRFINVADDITERKQAEQSLRETEARLTILSDNLPNGMVYQIDSGKDGQQRRFTYVSAGVEELHGVTAKEVLKDASAIYGQVVEEDRNMLAERERKALAQMSQFSAEVRIKMPSGALRWSMFISSPRRLLNGHLVWDGLEVDITERKQAEDALRETSKRLELALTTSRAGTWDWDVLTGIIKWSPEMYKLFEIDQHETTASFDSWRMRLHPEDAQLAESRIEKALKEKTPLNSDYRVVLPGGYIRWINATGEGFYDEKGQPNQMLGICLDITERKQAEVELRTNEARYKKAEVMGGVGNWEYNIQTANFWGSDEAKRIYGFDPDKNDFTTDEVENCIPERERVHQALVDLIEKDKEYDLEFEIHPKNSPAPRIITSKAELQRDDQGRPLRVVGVIQDITERKRNEKLMALQSEVLKVLTMELSIMQTVEQVIGIIKQAAGFDAVGLRLRTDEDYPFVASLGYSEEFLKAENTLASKYPDGGLCRNEDGTVSLECTCGMIVSGKADPNNPLFTPGGSAWTNNSLPFLDVPPDADPRLNPRNRCIHVGFLSLALIPIRTGAETIGLLHLADRHPGRFTPEGIRLFEGIGVSIGVALARKQGEEKIVNQLSELQRWQNTMLDREDRVIALKKEVNDLLDKLGQPQKYGG